MNAVDTNVIIYAHDNKEPIKQAKVRHLLTQLVGCSPATWLLWQVLGEFLQQLRRWKGIGDITEIELLQNLQAIRTKFPLRLPTSIVLDHALDLANRYSLSHWDSMLLGACVEAGVTTLYTEDMGAPRIIDNIQLVNPFILTLSGISHAHLSSLTSRRAVGWVRRRACALHAAHW